MQFLRGGELRYGTSTERYGHWLMNTSCSSTSSYTKLFCDKRERFFPYPLLEFLFQMTWAGLYWRLATVDLHLLIFQNGCFVGFLIFVFNCYCYAVTINWIIREFCVMLLFPVMPATVFWIPLRAAICFDASVWLWIRHVLFNLQSNYDF